MSEHDKYQMKTMRKSGISTTRIYGYFAAQAGGYENLGYSRRDMYNEEFKQRGRSSDADGALDFLKGLCSKDEMMYWRHTIKEDGTLQHLFWSDGVSRMDYSLFGDVLAFDATYRKIRYNTPLVIFSGVNHHNQSVIFGSAIVGDETEETYVWLLQNFVEAMEGKLLVSVITDGDLAMRNAIRRVFPNAHHRLCAWHLIRNASSNIKKTDFVTKFKHCLLGDFDVDEFERKWNALVCEFGLEENIWMLEMYRKRKMWATAHIRGNFFAGFRTTSRCEGLHSEFGKYVTVRSNLLDFLQQFFRWLSFMRYREIEADYSSSYGEVVLQTQHKSLESSAASLYTRSIFRLFRPVLERACRCKVVGVVQNGSIFTYTVYKYPREDIEWSVSYCEEKLKFECCCKRFETLGIACEHVMSVLIYLNIVSMPDCLVLNRWTKSAKAEVNATNANCSNQRDPTFITTYVTFVERCKRMVNAAFECGKPEYIRSTIEMVDKHTDVLEAVCRGEDVALSRLGLETEGTLGNPPRVRRKGGAVASSSINATKKRKRKPQKCGNCGNRGHNRISCGSQEEAYIAPQTQMMETFNYDDDDLLEDNEDCNIIMVCWISIMYF
jgi:hypothetical protein